MNKDLIDACQMFLVPATILFAAIGIARTEALKTLVSAIGVFVSGVWWWRIHEWTDLPYPDQATGLWLAGTFFVAALLSAGVHLYRWYAGETESSRT